MELDDKGIEMTPSIDEEQWEAYFDSFTARDIEKKLNDKGFNVSLENSIYSHHSLTTTNTNHSSDSEENKG